MKKTFATFLTFLAIPAFAAQSLEQLPDAFLCTNQQSGIYRQEVEVTRAGGRMTVTLHDPYFAAKVAAKLGLQNAPDRFVAIQLSMPEQGNPKDQECRVNSAHRFAFRCHPEKNLVLKGKTPAEDETISGLEFLSVWNTHQIREGALSTFDGYDVEVGVIRAGGKYFNERFWINHPKCAAN